MPRLRTLLAALLVAAGLAVPAAADVRPSYWLHVHAERNASVDLTFRTAVTLMRADARAYNQGGWAGFYLQPLGRRSHDGFGQVWLPALHTERFDRIAIPLGESAAASPHTAIGAGWRLPAGRYRLHVFGSGPVDVVALASARVPRGRLVATRPSAVSLAWDEALVTGAPGAAYAEAPVTVGPRALSASVALAVRRGIVYDVTSVDTCLGTAACLAGDDGVRHTLYERQHPVQWPTQGTIQTVVGRYYPGTLAPGAATAFATVRATGVVDRLIVAAFSLAL